MPHCDGSDLASPGSESRKALDGHEAVSLLRRPFLLNEQWPML